MRLFLGFFLRFTFCVGRSEDGRIDVLEIMVAIRREMQKEQRMLSWDSMGKYQNLYHDVINWKSGLQKGEDDESDI